MLILKDLEIAHKILSSITLIFENNMLINIVIILQIIDGLSLQNIKLKVL